MSRIVQYQSSFTMGEFDPLVKGRVDITQYQAGLEKATNVLCIPQGALERRPGQQFLLDVTSDLGSSFTAQQGLRLIPFEFSSADSFMLVFVKLSTSSSNNAKMFVFRQGVLQTNINSSGNNYLTVSLGDISFDAITFTQSADTLILMHEDLAPLSIVRGANNTTWTASTISITSPKFAFTKSVSEPSGDITPSSIDGTATISASASIFSSGNVNQYINVKNGFGRARIVEFVSATSVKVNVEMQSQQRIGNSKRDTKMYSHRLEVFQKQGYFMKVDYILADQKVYPRLCLDLRYLTFLIFLKQKV